MKVCAISGHRPTRFKFKYNENNNGCKRLKKRLKEQFTVLYDQGVRVFYIGGALGVDLWSGEILLRMKEQPEYADLQIVIAIPFEGHDKDWDERSKSRLDFLKHYSNVVVISENSGAESYKNETNTWWITPIICWLYMTIRGKFAAGQGKRYISQNVRDYPLY